MSSFFNSVTNKIPLLLVLVSLLSIPFSSKVLAFDYVIDPNPFVAESIQVINHGHYVADGKTAKASTLSIPLPAERIINVGLMRYNKANNTIRGYFSFRPNKSTNRFTQSAGYGSSYVELLSEDAEGVKSTNFNDVDSTIVSFRYIINPEHGGSENMTDWFVVNYYGENGEQYYTGWIKDAPSYQVLPNPNFIAPNLQDLNVTVEPTVDPNKSLVTAEVAIASSNPNSLYIIGLMNRNTDTRGSEGYLIYNRITNKYYTDPRYNPEPTELLSADSSFVDKEGISYYRYKWLTPNRDQNYQLDINLTYFDEYNKKSYTGWLRPEINYNPQLAVTNTGQLTMSLNATTPTGTEISTDGVYELAKFDFQARNEDISLKSLNLQIDNAEVLPYIGPVYLYDQNNTRLGTAFIQTVDDNHIASFSFTAGSYPAVLDGQVTTLTVKADVVNTHVLQEQIAFSTFINEAGVSALGLSSAEFLSLDDISPDTNILSAPKTLVLQ